MHSSRLTNEYAIVENYKAKSSLYDSSHMELTMLTFGGRGTRCCEVGGGGGGGGGRVIGGVGVVCGDGIDREVGGVVCGFVYGFVCEVVCGVVKAPISTMIVSVSRKIDGVVREESLCGGKVEERILSKRQPLSKTTRLRAVRMIAGCCEVGGGGGGGGGGVIGGVGVVCGDGQGTDIYDDCKRIEKDRWCGTRGKFVRWKGVRVTKASTRAKGDQDVDAKGNDY
nr:hypothetical protein [Tanacetum cinerariifolium]